MCKHLKQYNSDSKGPFKQENHHNHTIRPKPTVYPPKHLAPPCPIKTCEFLETTETWRIRISENLELPWISRRKIFYQIQGDKELGCSEGNEGTPLNGSNKYFQYFHPIFRIKFLITFIKDSFFWIKPCTFYGPEN